MMNARRITEHIARNAGDRVGDFSGQRGGGVVVKIDTHDESFIVPLPLSPDIKSTRQAFAPSRILAQRSTRYYSGNTLTATPGPRKTAVILVTFPGDPANPWSAAETRSKVFTGVNSADLTAGVRALAAELLAFRPHELSLRADGAPLFGWPAAQAFVSNLPFFYFNPLTGEPNPQLFVDNASFDSSRVYGQGAAFAMGPMTVSTRGPVCGTGTGLLGLLDAILCNLAVVLRL